mgnify:FL=1
MELSANNKNILKNLQKYPELSQTEQANLAGMSRTSYWRHVKNMEDAGFIINRSIELDAHKIGLKIRANCVISLNNHSKESRNHFENHIQQMDNVLECYATSGGKDYILSVVARDIDDYYDIMSTSILDHATISSAHTSFCMKKIKSTHQLPL